ncbi:hypothetical protein ACFL5Z_14850 [Planctomycetota bacterium]
MTMKLDDRLRREIQQRHQRAVAEGKTSKETTREQYRVTIELVRSLSHRKGKTRAKTLSNLKTQAQAHQADVLGALTSMGVSDFQMLPLSNSIKTCLTMAQLNKMAKHRDVSIIRLVKSEQVTT